MANPEHLEILKQGVGAWDEWRNENPDIKPELWGANLIGEDLRGARLRGADLRGAQFINTTLKRSDFNLANLAHADFTKADLTGAFLMNAHLRNANFSHAILYRASMMDATLTGATFDNADIKSARFEDSYLTNARFLNSRLEGANLEGADLTGAFLDGADFTSCIMGRTIIANMGLGGAIGLDAVIHRSPSTIGLDTLYKSEGKVPEVFLRGCGLSDWQIEAAKLYQPNLNNEEITNILYRIHELRAYQAIQINPLFISYNHTDAPFVDEMENYLNEKGIRFWRDIHHAAAGRLETQIDRAIRLNPTVLLILSEHSVESDWVQHEARLARKLELETKRDVLCPISLDDSWKDCRWPERLREQIMEYNILDFSNWKDEETFRRTFNRLLEGLDLFYK